MPHLFAPSHMSEYHRGTPWAFPIIWLSPCLQHPLVSVYLFFLYFICHILISASNPASIHLLNWWPHPAPTSQWLHQAAAAAKAADLGVGKLMSPPCLADNVCKTENAKQVSASVQASANQHLTSVRSTRGVENESGVTVHGHQQGFCSICKAVSCPHRRQDFLFFVFFLLVKLGFRSRTAMVPDAK